MEEKWLKEAFESAFMFHQMLLTGNTRDDRENDSAVLKSKVQRYSNFAGRFGLPQINADMSTAIQITEYLNNSKKMVASL